MEKGSMNLIFPMAVPSVPIKNATQAFPVHRIYCVGRNYVEHAKEMGWTGREAPFFFMKPADAVLPVAEGEIGRMPFPSETSNLHHEIELEIAIGKSGAAISLGDAASFIWGYAVGLDMTRRDLQAESKAQGRPWCTAKGFDFSAPISAITPASQIKHIEAAAISLDVNGVRRQAGRIDQLIWNIAEIIVSLSKLYTLQTGDLIFTGTPAGVAAVNKGDLMVGQIEGLGSLQVTLV